MTPITRRTAFTSAGAAMLGASFPTAKGAEGAALHAGPQFNVRDFGAVGDGKADDAEAAQKALDAALAAGGGHVYFPAGQYRLSKGLVIREARRLDITGDGLTSELRYEADAPALTWSPDAACIMSSVRDLCFSATGTDKTSSTPAIACLGGTERGTLFDQLHIRADGVRMGSGIVVEKVMDTTTLNHCTITGVTGTGIQIPRGSEVRIVGGRVIGSIPPHTGIADGSTGILMTGDNGGVHIITTDLIGLDSGMQIGVPGGAMNRETFITHATFDSCRRGLWIRNAAYVSISGCWAVSSDEPQIILDSEKHALVPHGALLVISGGTIGNGGTYGRAGAHHGLVARSGAFVLNGTALWHNKGSAIHIEGDKVHDFTITGCRFSNNGTAAALGGVPGSLMGNTLLDNAIAFTGSEKIRNLQETNVILPAPADAVKATK